MKTTCDHCKEEFRIEGTDIDQATPDACPECGHEVDLLDLTIAVNRNLEDYRDECEEERACHH